MTTSLADQNNFELADVTASDALLMHFVSPTALWTSEKAIELTSATTLSFLSSHCEPTFLDQLHTSRQNDLKLSNLFRYLNKTLQENT